jgi:hypothetical protein
LVCSPVNDFIRQFTPIQPNFPSNNTKIYCQFISQSLAVLCC